ncbi:PepSY domain-containing protein [Aquimarina sp. AU119]|uniref:PepSY-associated TM helix domain-containing protein n=2 Tax=Aquimarina TaxID=290174 RepID=UPI00135A0DF8|nr:PepSY-associated TM helix domain-containing protein [Aquimarina sp. AU119]
MKNTFKKTIRFIHLWLGLTTGLVVFIVCLTGSIYAFQKEIKLLVYPYYQVEESAKSRLALSDLVHAYEEQSEHQVLRIYDFKEPSRSTMLLTIENKAYYYSFINPYTGEILNEVFLARDFFTIILYIHMNLLLGEIGTQIIGWSVIVFIISLISGLILWFPKNNRVFKNKKGRKSQFGIKINAPKKKLTYDLHKVLGFYAASILIVLAITGIAWTFTWVDNALYTAVTFEKKKEEKPIAIDSTNFRTTSLDALKEYVLPQREDKDLFIYFLPNTNTEPVRVMSSPGDDRFGNSDNYYADPSSGSIISTKFDEEKNAGQKLNSLYYDIHTGSLLGLGGKILVFLAGLIGASLPVTGVMLYMNRRKKRKKKKRIVTETIQNEEIIEQKHEEMKNKIALLWLFLAVGFILHHIYGLAGIYFGKELAIEGTNGETPGWAHYYRILFEIIILILSLASLELTKKWFKITSFVWAILLGLFNTYHVVEAILYEASNTSEIILLGWMVAVSILLILSLNKWKKIKN